MAEIKNIKRRTVKIREDIILLVKNHSEKTDIPMCRFIEDAIRDKFKKESKK